MIMGKSLIIILSVIYGFVYFIIAAKTKKPFKTIFSFAALGLLGLMVINLTSKFSGVYIPVNVYTVSLNAALGLPATITLLLLRLIFM